MIADDLTGSLDAGLQAWKAGLRVCVRLPGRSVPATDLSPELIVADTESRNLDAGAARTAVTAAVGLIRGESRTLVYKKIDSTLRGRIGVEIATILGEAGLPAAL